MTESMRRKKIGERIRTARLKKGMSQERLGEALDVSFQAVSSWEQGKFIPDPDRLPALSEALDISLDALFADREGDWTLRSVNSDADRMFTFVKGRAQMLNLPKTLKVMELLRPAHEKQPRWSRYGFDTTYLVHPLTLACHALAMGIRDDEAVAACLAHDMLEDTPVREEDLPEGRVREAVKLVSKNLYDHRDPDWEDRYYERIRENPLACLVKCLDRVHNLTGMADSFRREKMVEYTEETDRYYPALLEALKKDPEYSDAWWLLRYHLTSLEETFKRLL